MKPRKANRGSVLIVALLLRTMIGISLVSYNKLAQTALSSALRSVLSLTTVNVAEMGIEQAMASFYQISIGTAAATALVRAGRLMRVPTRLAEPFLLTARTSIWGPMPEPKSKFMYSTTLGPAHRSSWPRPSCNLPPAPPCSNTSS
jgi:flavin-binding protein dodecin